MKKALFLGAMAALLLGTASCSNDMEPAMGGEVPVSFAIDLGDNIDSRTISDGTGANRLKFAVFENGAEITALAQTVAVADKHATINTKLVKGHTYSFVFWAQNSACTAYNTSDMSAIKVDYAANCNDETRDAFYKMDSFTVTEAFEKPEVLTRPFAQINFLADDAAGVNNVDAYKSKVTVTGVPTTLNTLDGTVSGTTDVTFALATIPNETLAGYQSYKYVAMNYILAATDKELKNTVELTVNDGTQDVNKVTVTECPVQRNYRTNIFGSLFTLDGKFNIVIDPIYAGNLQPEVMDIVAEPGRAIYNSVEYSSVREAMRAALVDKDEVKIELADGDYVGDDFLYTSGLKDANGARIGDNKTISVKSKSGIPENVILRTLMMTSTVTLKVKGITLCNTTADGTALKLADMATTYGGNGEHFMSQSSICMVWTYGSVEFENVIFQNNATDGTSIYTYWGTETMYVTAKNCIFTGNQYQRASQIYGRTVALFENCTFDKVYRYCACIHGGYNDIRWINNTVLEDGLNPSKQCNAIEHGSSSYHRGANDPQDLIYVEGGNYPATGNSFVPYHIAYDEQPILSGTMPDGSVAIWQ